MGDSKLSIIFLTLLALALAVALCGCPARTQSSLPADWPIAELTIPAGSIEEIIVDHSDGEKKWKLYLNDSMPWDRLAQHVESCLAPLGYSEFYTLTAQGDDKRDRIRTYLSADLLTSFSMMNTVAMGRPAGSDKPEYGLMLKIGTQPYGDAALAGTTSAAGVQYFLEPLE
ncbi:hypothetical protein JW859_15360 [bacterium]|nr:hypothetical protein [bacterium]